MNHFHALPRLPKGQRLARRALTTLEWPTSRLFLLYEDQDRHNRHPRFSFIPLDVHQQTPLSLIGIRYLSVAASNQWKRPDFSSTVQEKEAWLNGLLTDPKTADSVGTEAFLLVLRALAASSDIPDAPMRAERWLGRLERYAEEHNFTVAIPTAECYQRVIECWANSSREDPAIAVVRAERWLTKRLDCKIESMRPNTATFNAFLDVCSKGRAMTNSKKKDLVRWHAQRAQDTIKYMIADRVKHGDRSRIAPNTESFNFLIRAWTRCRKSFDIADRAMEALRQLERYQSTMDGSVKPDIKSYAMVMDAIATKAKLKVKRVRNARHLWEDSKENGMEEMALLNDIVDYTAAKTATSSISRSPNTTTMNIFISAWSHLAMIHLEAPEQAEKVLQRMIELKDNGVDEAAPDTVTYLMVMRAWTNSEKLNRGQRVAWWLSKQWKDFDFEGNPSLRPTTATYNQVIRTWADLGDPFKAEQTLSELIGLSSHHGDDLLPNSESFSAVIRAWLSVADNGSEQALTTAYRWLESLMEREKSDARVQTPVDLYTRILGSARKCSSKCPDVLDIAVDTFDKLRTSYHQLDSIHYSRLLQTGLLALSRPENNKVRQAFIQQIVSDCIEDGLVSNLFLQALANGPIFYDGWTIEESMRMVDDLFPNWPLPDSWTRNVRQRDNLPRRSDTFRTLYKVSQHGVDPYKR